MKKLLPCGLLLTSLALATTSAYADIAVTNGNNSGSGSLRAALAQGNDDIVIDDLVTTIKITETLQYDSTRRLRIDGVDGPGRQTIDGSGIDGNGDILSVNEGSNVRIRNVNFIGNADEVNENSNDQVGGKGIFVSIPVTETGTVSVLLRDVDISRVGDHAVHVSDCSLRDNCGGGSGGGGIGSEASVRVDFRNVIINRVGFGLQDGDGVRVDERGSGDITFTASRSSFLNAGADGIELDEGDDGDIIAEVSDSLFDSNGSYCGVIPFDDGSLCDNDGDPDLDDAFDIDEAGNGSIFVEITDTQLTNNFDEGLDFDETGDGNIEIDASNVLASNNVDQGIRASEEDDGDVISLLTNVTLVDNNDDGEAIELEEDNDGDLSVVIVDSNAIGGDDEQITLIEDNSGDGEVEVINSYISLDLDNVDEI